MSNSKITDMIINNRITYIKHSGHIQDNFYFELNIQYNDQISIKRFCRILTAIIPSQVNYQVTLKWIRNRTAETIPIKRGHYISDECGIQIVPVTKSHKDELISKGILLKYDTTRKYYLNLIGLNCSAGLAATSENSNLG